MSLRICWIIVSIVERMFSDLGLIRLAQDESDEWAIVDAEAEGNRVAEAAAEASLEVDGAF